MSNYNCRICRSGSRSEIEEALHDGKAFRDIAKQFIGFFDCNLHLLEQSIARHKKNHNDKPQERILTKEQIDFLDRISEGKVGLEEGSRIVATMVFEKMLNNPDKIKFADFYNTELLKIKQTEVRDRNYWAMEMINKWFKGRIPPRYCPKCGQDVLHGEKNEDSSIVKVS